MPTLYYRALYLMLGCETIYMPGAGYTLGADYAQV